MFRAQKNDWRLALCIAIVITGLSVFTSRIDIPFYAIAVSCISVGICTLFETPKPHQLQEGAAPVIWYKQEKFRILLASAFFFCVFFGLGFVDGGSMPALYRLALPAIIIVAPFFLFGTFLFTIVYIRSSYFDKGNRSES